MKNLMDLINELIFNKFSGDVIITMSQGGIRSMKKARYEKLI